MVHWKRDLDLYTIGRPLERNAGFWLNYMKGLKGDHGDTGPVRSSEPVLTAAPRSRLRSPPRAAAAEPPSPASGAGRDPFSDPFFKRGAPEKEEPFTAPDPLDGVTLPDDVRDIIDRARQRHRNFRADADRRAARF